MRVRAAPRRTIHAWRTPVAIDADMGTWQGITALISEGARPEPRVPEAPRTRACVRLWDAARCGESPMFTLAHLSDLHATPVEPKSPLPLLGKRVLGWLSWRVRRHRVHRPEVLEALIADLEGTGADQVVITGDMTNISLASEFPAARDWLRRIGSPERVTAIPGNHDAYVRVPRQISWDLWAEYLVSDAAGRELLGSEERKTEGLEFPSVRLRGPLALVGISSAVPSLPLRATGRVGRAQLERLERVLGELADAGRCRVVLIHHPPDPGALSARRSLTDAEELCGLLRRVGAELVLHGHTHRTRLASLPGPQHPIPVVGARSASDLGIRPEKCARYHLYDIERNDGERGGEPGGPPFRIALRSRAYDPVTGAVVSAEETALC